MKHFSLKQFACRLWCKMPEEVTENIEALVVNILDPVFEMFSKFVGSSDEQSEEEPVNPIKVNAGYICKKHITELGMSSRSAHTTGEAADICAEPKLYSNMMAWREANRLLASLVIKNGKFDTIILVNVGEDNLNPQWVHVAFSRSVNRGKVMKKITGQKDYVELTTDDICELLGTGFKYQGERNTKAKRKTKKA